MPSLGASIPGFSDYVASLRGHLTRLVQDLPLDARAEDPSPTPGIHAEIRKLRSMRRGRRRDEDELLDFYELLEEIQVRIGHAVLVGHEAGPPRPRPPGWADWDCSIFATRLDLMQITGAATNQGVPSEGWQEAVPGPSWKRVIASGRGLDVLLQVERRTDEEFENWEWLARPSGTEEWFVPAEWYLWLDGRRWPTGHWMSRENEWFIRNIGHIEAAIREAGPDVVAEGLARARGQIRT